MMCGNLDWPQSNNISCILLLL